jgi:hypothetical protein
MSPAFQTLAIAWADGQSRTDALARGLDGDAVFVTSRLARRPATAPVRYLAAALCTWRLLERRRPAAHPPPSGLPAV